MAMLNLKTNIKETSMLDVYAEIQSEIVMRFDVKVALNFFPLNISGSKLALRILMNQTLYANDSTSKQISIDSVYFSTRSPGWRL